MTEAWPCCPNPACIAHGKGTSAIVCDTCGTKIEQLPVVDGKPVYEIALRPVLAPGVVIGARTYSTAQLEALAQIADVLRRRQRERGHCPMCGRFNWRHKDDCLLLAAGGEK